jgi:ABC-type dipeptide/oligopeptide/nickel transport system ATPase component
LCPFRPRCSEKRGQCDELMPQEIQTGDGHFVSCWAAGEDQ